MLIREGRVHARANVDWLTLDATCVTQMFTLLREGIVRDIFSQKASMAWNPACLYRQGCSESASAGQHRGRRTAHSGQKEEAYVANANDLAGCGSRCSNSNIHAT